ncbi:MAG: zf-HC2 domain-containing protein [Candidatus Rokubacteria bacterium]|nr:zf-HC2 domain-containing protein [Candidatus Rokubacteria bacterium]
MECQELRQPFHEWREGRLSSEQSRALERHLATCPDCQRWEREETAVRRLLAERLPRHPAPARLREQIQDALAPRKAQPWWWASVAALGSVMLMVLVLLPNLLRPAPPDPLQPFVRSVLSQHTRTILWGEPRPEVVPDVLPRLMEETRIRLSKVFMGDEEVRLVGVEPVVLQGRWGLAFFYKDPEDHMITYLMLPGEGLSVPDRNRVKIDGFRPLLARIDGFSVFVWKQKDLALFLISDLVSESDLTRFRQYFLRIRSATEPRPLPESR